MSAMVPYVLQRPGHTPMRDYTAAALSGDVEKAAALAAQMEPARLIHDKWLVQPFAARKEIAIAYLKAWTEFMGMAGGMVRPPLAQSLTPSEANCAPTFKRSDCWTANVLARWHDHFAPALSLKPG